MIETRSLSPSHKSVETQGASILSNDNVGFGVLPTIEVGGNTVTSSRVWELNGAFVKFVSLYSTRLPCSAAAAALQVTSISPVAYISIWRWYNIEEEEKR